MVLVDGLTFSKYHMLLVRQGCEYGCRGGMRSPKSIESRFVPHDDISTKLNDSFSPHHLTTSNHHSRAQALPVCAANTHLERHMKPPNDHSLITRLTVSKHTDHSTRRLHHPLISPPHPKTPQLRFQNAKERPMTTKSILETTLSAQPPHFSCNRGKPPLRWFPPVKCRYQNISTLTAELNPIKKRTYHHDPHPQGCSHAHTRARRARRAPVPDPKPPNPTVSEPPGSRK